MEAIRVTAKPINGKIVIDLPPGMESEYCEVIILKGHESSKEGIKRKPPPQLAETGIHDDLIDPAVPETDWDALK